MISRHGLRAAFVLAAALVASSTVQAASFNAFEQLVDAPPYDRGAATITRTYWSDLGHTWSGSVPSGQVDANFGVMNLSDVSYLHDLTFLGPATFASATLTINAWGNIGGNEQVVTETLDITGFLNNPTLFSLGFSTSMFSNAAILSGLNVDGTLAVAVNKNTYMGGFYDDELWNYFSVYSSRLDVTGRTLENPGPDVVPEPTSLVLLGAGLIAGAARMRRRS